MKTDGRTERQIDVTKLNVRSDFTSSCRSESTDRSERCTVSVRITTAVTVCRVARIGKGWPTSNSSLTETTQRMAKATGCDDRQLCVSCNMPDSATAKRLLHSKLVAQPDSQCCSNISWEQKWDWSVFMSIAQCCVVEQKLGWYVYMNRRLDNLSGSLCRCRWNLNTVMARLYRYSARFLGQDAVSLDDYYPTFRRSYLKFKALLFNAQLGKKAPNKTS